MERKIGISSWGISCVEKLRCKDMWCREQAMEKCGRVFQSTVSCCSRHKNHGGTLPRPGRKVTVIDPSVWLTAKPRSHHLCPVEREEERRERVARNLSAAVCWYLFTVIHAFEPRRVTVFHVRMICKRRQLIYFASMGLVQSPRPPATHVICETWHGYCPWVWW